MKYLLLLLFCPALAFSQISKAGYDSIPKGVTIIKVHGVGFREVVNHLLDVGYNIDKIDSNFNLVKTTYKPMKNYVMAISYNIRVKDSVAIIQGDWLSGNTEAKIENQKWAALKATFLAMNNFARWFGKPVEYFKD